MSDDRYQNQPLRIRIARWLRHMPIAYLMVPVWLFRFLRYFRQHAKESMARAHEIAGESGDWEPIFWNLMAFRFRTVLTIPTSRAHGKMKWYYTLAETFGQEETANAR